jgi:hypothetical protein
VIQGIGDVGTQGNACGLTPIQSRRAALRKGLQHIVRERRENDCYNFNKPSHGYRHLQRLVRRTLSVEDQLHAVLLLHTTRTVDLN